MENESMLISVFLGAVSGIFTTAVVYIISIIVKDKILPWYRAFKYEGLDVSGEWKIAQDFDDSAETGIVELTQKADKLEGSWTITITNKKTKESELKMFSLNGSIEDRFVILTTKNSNNRQIGMGTILLEAVGNGYELIGCETWYSVENKEIKSDDITFIRKK